MAEETKTPVAIRVTRPYASDEDFLQHEIETLTRTTVVLLGAQSRPQGVILRFEITLATGTPLLRGEGRVVAFRQASQGVDAGLTLRFTRLDARSKALVDRAASLREARARAASIHPPRLDGESTPTPPRSSPPRAEAAPTAQGLPAPPPSSTRPRRNSTAPAATPAPVAPASSRRSPGSLRAPPARRREELLDRLRQRAKKLTPEEVASLLASRKRPATPSA